MLSASRVQKVTERMFVQVLERTFRQDGFLTKKEVGVGYGVADLVVVREKKLSKRNLKLRYGYGQKARLLKEEYFQVLKQLPDYDSGKNPVDINFLVNHTNLSKSFLKYTIIKFLKKNRYIVEENGKHYFKVNGWVPLADEIIAIEAKMKSWKRGFIQANRYKAFADKVYLAVPSSIIHLVDKKLLSKHGVGLLSLDYSNNKRVVEIEARNNKVLNEAKRNFATEFFWNSETLRELSLL